MENFGKVIAETAEVVAKKTEDTIEIQKIKSQIRVMERNNKKDFQKIGKMVYERFQKGNEDDIDFDEICEVIEEREKSIAELKKSIASIKGFELCESCNEHLEPTASYCPKCGTKAKEEFEEEI